MRSKKKAQKKERSAMTVSLYANLFFVIVELVMAVLTSSQAVLLDAVYDGIELCMLLPSVLLIPLLYRPATERHPFGYMQLETLFLVLKGVTMTAVTIGLITGNIDLLLHGGRTVAFGRVACFELFACALGVAVTLSLRQKNRSLNSPLIAAEMMGWRVDSIISLGMGIAFLLPLALPLGRLAPYLDQIVTIILSMIMLPMPVKTVISAVRDLMLIPPEEATIQDIKRTVEPILAEYNYSHLYYDIVKTGRKLWISAYISLDKDQVSLTRFQVAQARCIRALEATYPDFYFELLPDLEPEDAPAAP